MPSSAEYRDFTKIDAGVIADSQAAHASYSLTTATDGTEQTKLLTLINAMKAGYIDVWKVLLDAAVQPGPYFRVRI